MNARTRARAAARRKYVSLRVSSRALDAAEAEEEAQVEEEKGLSRGSNHRSGTADALTLAGCTAGELVSSDERRRG